MKITKFEHACFAVEQDGQALIVDPGNFTRDLNIPDNVVAVVITHEHADHLDKDLLQAIVDKNPDAVIVAHSDITVQLDGLTRRSVVANEGAKIGNFELEFFGGQHAVIFDDMPVIANLGVLINKTVYYPGDSFTVPDQQVDVLALPVTAPWLKVNEVVQFLTAIKPRFAFPTHDAISSDTGKELLDRMLLATAEKIGTTYQRLSEPLEA